MRNSVVHRLVKPLLLVLVGLLLVICGQRLLIPHPTAIVQSNVLSSRCRVVKHWLGEACVPVEPKRIVALDPIYILDPLLSLGVKPIGSAADTWRGQTFWGGIPADQATGIEGVGQTYLPSLEKLLLLKPDLIVGLTDLESYYPQLNAIAPTVLFDYQKQVKPSFKQHLRTIAQVVGQEARAETVLKQYQARIDALKAQLNGRLAGKEITVIYHSDGNFWAPDQLAVFFQILKDMGMSLKLVQLPVAPNLLPTFSIEMIQNYDADILFICDEDRKDERFFLNNPLIASLQSAQNQRLYVVDGNRWRAFGPIVIDLIVDDLSNFLLKAAASFETGE